jgi:beta-hydroxylase
VLIGFWLVVATAAMFIASMTYVYGFRGDVRYAGPREYFSHAWPIFAPINCLLYAFTEKRGRGPILDLSDFPELAPIQENWQTIRAEALELHRRRCFESINEPGESGHYDIGFRTFFKYGWRKFYLKWYGYTHQSAIEACPKTVEILKGIPSVRGAMLSTLPAGGKLTRHIDPLGCSVRYHLGLATPNSDACYLNVDGNVQSWRDGEAFLFDETYPHFAANDSEDERIILMCDVERPTWLLGRVLNRLLLGIMPLTVVPNTDQDRAGFANRLFRGVMPIVDWSKKLKAKNWLLYKTLNYLLNLTLIAIPVALLFALISAVRWLGNLFA